jgi:hypothetical protein
MIQILENHPNPNDIICFIDAYDVLCFSNIEEIYTKFKQYNCNILLSSELNCYPPNNLPKYELLEYQLQQKNEQFEKVFSTNFKYVNSGGYIGYCKDLLQMLKWKSVAEIVEICKDGGDQTYFSLYYLKHALNTNLVQIDYKQTIFQSMYKVHFTDFSFINGRLYNRILHTYPCFAHFNGYKIYDEMIVSNETNKEENVYEVFLQGLCDSLDKPDVEKIINYRVLFFLFYNGQYQFHLPQI